MAMEMSEQIIKDIIVGMLSGDAQVQRQIVDTYISEDIEFIYPLFHVQGKTDFYRMYRGWYGFVRSGPTFHDYLQTAPGESPGKVMIWVNQHLGPRIVPYNLGMLVVVVILHWRREKDGLFRIYLQDDHMSAYTLPLSFGHVGVAFQNYVTRPLSKLIVTSAAQLLDWWTETPGKGADVQQLHSIPAAGSILPQDIKLQMRQLEQEALNYEETIGMKMAGSLGTDLESKID